MRLAVISDIHSNFPALQAVAQDLKSVAPDEILVAGDFINRGPQPREVLDFLGERGWVRLRGNHEDYVIAQLEPHAPTDTRRNPVWQPAQWTAAQIRATEGDGSALKALPLQTLRGTEDEVLIVHGTPQRNNDGVFSFTTDDELRAMLGYDDANRQPPRVLVCAHTHASLIRSVDNTLVMNVGAMGLPFNRDPRAQYGILEKRDGAWHAELRLVEYDREATYRAFETGGFLKEGGPLARVIMQEVRDAAPHLGPWVRAYFDAVQGGETTVEDATERYFAML